MGNTKNVPRLRFPGFTDAWEQRKLSELATMHARIGWQNLRTSEFLDDGDYMLITGTDFEDGRINFSTCHYVEKERYDQDKHIQISDGSILITKDGTLGKVAYVQGLQKPATLNAGVFNVEIKDENEVDGKYIFQYLKAPFLMDYVGQKATGGTIKHLNQNILVDFPVVIPKKAEQEKIGQYFEKIDNLITLHQRKCDEVKKLKKCMLQKMFPKNGEQFPEIRFPGFTDAWEQRKLVELTDRIIVGLATSVTPFYRESGVPLLRNMNIKENYLDDSDILYLEEEYANANQSKMIHEKDVLTVHTGSNIGLTCIAPKQYEGSLSFTTLITTPSSGKLDSIFLMQYMNSSLGRKGIEAIITAGGKPNLNSGDLEKLLISYPKVDEQKKIGDFFSNLDNLITLHQRKCNEIKLLKKAMLQQMFV